MNDSISLPSINKNGSNKANDADVFIPLVPRLTSARIGDEIKADNPLPPITALKSRSFKEIQSDDQGRVDISRNPVHFSSGALSVEASLVDSGVFDTDFPEIQSSTGQINWELLDSYMAPYYSHQPKSTSRSQSRSKNRSERSRSRNRGQTYGSMWGDESSFVDPNADPSTLTVEAREKRIRSLQIEAHLHQAMRQYERLIENENIAEDDKAANIHEILRNMTSKFRIEEMGSAAKALVATATSTFSSPKEHVETFSFSEHSQGDRYDKSPQTRSHNQIDEETYKKDAARQRGSSSESFDINGEGVEKDTLKCEVPSPLEDGATEAAGEGDNGKVWTVNSKVRDSLHKLSNFVGSYTFRKIKGSWNFIESKFKTSPYYRTENRVKNGISLPVKCPVLSLYTLTGILCSSRAKIGPQEIHSIYSKLGVPEEAILNIRRVCALNVVVALDPDNKLKTTLRHRLTLQQLMRAEDRQITKEELMDAVFPGDPVEREKELQSIKENKQAELQAIMDEKKRKDDLKEKQQARIAILKENFEQALAQVQFMKAKTLTQEKFEEFCDLISTSATQLEQYNKAKASHAPPDIVYFLGLDAFPESFQESFRAKKEIAEKRARAASIDKTHKGSRKRTETATDIASTASAIDAASIAREKLKKFYGLKIKLSGNKPVDKDEFEDLHSLVDVVKDDSSVSNSSVHSEVAPKIDSKGKKDRRKSSIASDPAPPNIVSSARVSKRYASKPYSLMSMFRQTVAIGRGLSGWGYAEVVCLLQYLASSRITCMFRCYRRRWRYNAARSMWKAGQKRMRASHLRAWRDFTKRVQINRRYAMRQLTAWKFYTKRAKERRHLFKCCFWIFRTWRKAAEKTAVAKEKTRFLVGRVMPTVLMLKVFGAWKKHQQAESDRFKKSTNNYRALIRRHGITLLHWLRQWAHDRRLIRQAWIREGRRKYNHQIRLKRLIPFMVWRSFVTYRKIIRRRVRTEYLQFRQHALPADLYLHPLRLTSNAEKRLFKVRAAGKQVGGGNKHHDGADDDDVTHHPHQDDDRDDKTVRRKKTKRRKKYSGPIFDWKANTNHIYDLLSDEEEGVEVETVENDKGKNEFDESPPRVLYDLEEKYNSATITPMPLAPYSIHELSDFQLSFLVGKDSRILRLVRAMHKGLCLTDQGNLLEAAMRFHRYAHRAFNNLRIYATYAVRAKTMRARRIRAIKIIVFAEFKKIFDSGLGKANSIALSEAERLHYLVRSHLIQKTTRLRAATDDIKEHLGPEEDEIDDEERAAKKMKMLNLIDPDDVDYLEEQRKIREQKEKERQEKINNSGYVPPNLLEWDREDRETELDLAERMVQFSESTNKSNVAVVIEADQTSSSRLMKETRSLNMLKEVLELETEKTVSAIQREKAFTDKFWEHAADRLLAVLAKVYAEVQLSLAKEESKIYFRMLRLPMLLSRSKSMLHRKKISNWIRICNRLNAISRRANFYFKKRQLWITLNRWFKFIEIVTTTCTPGFGPSLKRRSVLFHDLNRSLAAQGFIKVVYFDNRRLEKIYSQPHNIFHRWKMYTQEIVVFENLSRKVHEKYRLQLLQKCFWAIKTSLSLEDNLGMISQAPPSFPLARVEADIEQIKKRFLVNRKRGLSQVIRKYNGKFRTKVMAEGRSAFSFKKFVMQFRAQTQARISAEQRLLSQAFERRGTVEFLDLHFPIPPPRLRFHEHDHEKEKGKDKDKNSEAVVVKSRQEKEVDPLIPAIMVKVMGSRFSDPAGSVPLQDREQSSDDSVEDEYDEEENDEGSSLEQMALPAVVPAGFKLSRISFAMQEHLGICGWQLFWSADGAKDIESAKRGNFNAIGTNVQEIKVPKGDFFVGLEYLYDGIATVGVRLKLHFGGFTRWVGGKNSMSTLSVYLGANNSPKQEFESFRDKCIGSREREEPAYPLEAVIGLTGIITGGQPAQQRATRLGLVVRKVKKQYLFSYYWVNDILQQEEAARLVIQKAAAAAKAAAEEAARIAAEFHWVSSKHSIKHHNGSVGSHSKQGDAVDSLDGNNDDDGAATGRPQSSKPAPQPQDAGIETTVKEDREMKASEVQFFDVLRMRSMEIEGACKRAENFARHLWTTKSIQDHPTLSKLVRVRIIAALSKWLFNGINKYLIGLCDSEHEGQALLKQSKTLSSRAVNFHLRAEAARQAAEAMEVAKQPWTGKSMLSPQERAMRKEHQRRIKLMKEDADRLDREGDRVTAEATAVAREGELLLPRLDLCTKVVANYRIKIDAARHKESLLENMSLEEMRTGLFGTTENSPLLSKDLMKVLHSSLSQTKKAVPKDVLTLDQLVGQLLASERVNAAEGIASSSGDRLRLIGSRQSYSHSSLTDDGAADGFGRVKRKAPLPVTPIVLPIKLAGPSASPSPSTTTGKKSSSPSHSRRHSRQHNSSSKAVHERKASSPMSSILKNRGSASTSALGVTSSNALNLKKKTLSVTTPAVLMALGSPMVGSEPHKKNEDDFDDDDSLPFSLMSDGRTDSPQMSLRKSSKMSGLSSADKGINKTRRKN